ncbi:symplekin-like isoform X2 [Antedon mediterranea]|uniref:symplekin-like isoform X2 n=1 Tax=Antedon mediterranea TaxID=105859 RepID=UPI003AF9E88E
MSTNHRRSIASQFFAEEDSDASQANAKQISTADKVVELINETQLLPKDSQKIQNLKQVQELIVNKDPTLLDNFLDEVLQFQNDKSADVRRFVVGFIEEACKKDNELLVTVVMHLNMILSDPAQNVAVLKRVILCNAQLYRVAIKWVLKSKIVREEKEAMWQNFKDMKSKIKAMIDSENDGVRTHAIKFMEMLIVTSSPKTADSEVPKKKIDDISLDKIPEDHPILKYRHIKADAINGMDLLLKLMATPSITSVNLIACMGVVTSICKQRPMFMKDVIEGLEALHANLPPTLAKSQVSSVRKNLKLHLMSILRHPSSETFHARVITLLQDLGASDHEIFKAVPRSENLKRSRGDENNHLTNKKAKILDDDEGMDEEATTSVPVKPPSSVKAISKQTPLDLLTEEIKPLLDSSENVANIVLISMVTLPESMPAHFQAMYTPIAAAGTDSQVQHLARMMATQFIPAGIKPKKEIINTEADDLGIMPTPRGIPVLGGSSGSVGDNFRQPSQFAAPKGVKRIKQFKLADVTKPISTSLDDKMMTMALQRIIDSGKNLKGPALQARNKMIVLLTTQFGGPLINVLQEYVLSDLRANIDLAFSWLYQEYAKYRGYMLILGDESSSLERYDALLCRILASLLVRDDQRDGVFARLGLESPIITPNALKIIKRFCEHEIHFFVGMKTLRDIILNRPASMERYLDNMLELTWNEKIEVRSQATQYVKRFYEKADMRQHIEHFATTSLQHLTGTKPPPSMVITLSAPEKRVEANKTWTEETAKICLNLYLALLPINHKLIHELATVYVAASAVIKRIVLRSLETPVRGMGMSSPELLTLLETSPKGAETLITRMLHILTDKVPPSQDLVKRVRDLYQKRVPDVRFLIPVLIGLEKSEVMSALPKLIKLNPNVVKEVFHRLLMSHQEGGLGQSPLTPAELLVALHNVDMTKCDMKSVIKATSLCFSQKNIYTQEVLAVVMQQLMEQTPIPTLLMRTVIQSLSMYPRLIGFVMNILQRLIVKQVWRYPKVWEGFIKCCERTKPQSFQVLLQLPPSQLTVMFETSPDLRLPLLEHVKSFTPHQQAHIPKTIMTVLETDAVAAKIKREQEAIEQKRRDKEEEERKKKVAEEKARQQRLLQEKIERERRMKEEEAKAKKRKEQEEKQLNEIKAKLQLDKEKKEKDEMIRKTKEAELKAEEERLKKERDEKRKKLELDKKAKDQKEKETKEKERKETEPKEKQHIKKEMETNLEIKEKEQKSLKLKEVKKEDNTDEREEEREAKERKEKDAKAREMKEKEQKEKEAKLKEQKEKAAIEKEHKEMEAKELKEKEAKELKEREAKELKEKEAKELKEKEAKVKEMKEKEQKEKAAKLKEQKEKAAKVKEEEKAAKLKEEKEKAAKLKEEKETKLKEQKEKEANENLLKMKEANAKAQQEEGKKKKNDLDITEPGKVNVQNSKEISTVETNEIMPEEKSKDLERKRKLEDDNQETANQEKKTKIEEKIVDTHEEGNSSQENSNETLNEDCKVVVDSTNSPVAKKQPKKKTAPAASRRQTRSSQRTAKTD